MSKTVDVETSVGTWTIKKPAAGPRNRAMIKAESGDGVIQYTLLMVTLLPKMVTVRASGVDPDIPIEAVLDGLEIEDYDALSSAGMPLVFGGKTEVKKKQSVISSTTGIIPERGAERIWILDNFLIGAGYSTADLENMEEEEYRFKIELVLGLQRKMKQTNQFQGGL